MAKRSLGSNWRQRTPQEQDEFVRLFTDILEAAYADIIESYTDEKIVYVNERIDGGFADVDSKIVTRKAKNTRSTIRPTWSATNGKFTTWSLKISAW